MRRAPEPTQQGANRSGVAADGVGCVAADLHFAMKRSQEDRHGWLLSVQGNHCQGVGKAVFDSLAWGVTASGQTIGFFVGVNVNRIGLVSRQCRRRRVGMRHAGRTRLAFSFRCKR